MFTASYGLESSGNVSQSRVTEGFDSDSPAEQTSKLSLFVCMFVCVLYILLLTTE